MVLSTTCLVRRCKILQFLDKRKRVSRFKHIPMARVTTCAYKPSPFFVKVGSGFLTFDRRRREGVQQGLEEARKMPHFEMHMLSTLYQELCGSHEIIVANISEQANIGL